jgi:hypothetical protein
VKTIVTFEFDSPAEAAAVLRNLTTTVDAPKEEAAAAPKLGRPTKAEAAAKAAAAATPPSAATAPSAAPAPPPQVDAGALLAKVKELIGKLVGVNRRAEAVALLAKYNAQKASEVPAEKLAECLVSLEEALAAESMAA